MESRAVNVTWFGGTIFPFATITVEPLAEAGAWWAQVEADGAESEVDYFDPWREMIHWFGQRPEFQATAFVRIGDLAALWSRAKCGPRGRKSPAAYFPD